MDKNYDDALTCAEVALATHETALGVKHPWTNESAHVTADALDALGRAGEALALRTRYAIERGGAA
jgi:hypothetical protein